MKRVFSQTFGVVGALLEKDGKILLVKEALGDDKGKWSQPAGWIDVGEDPIKAAKREVEEETGYKFEPKFVLGFYSLVREDLKYKYQPPPHALKIIFIGDNSENQEVKLHDDVSEVKWFSPEEIQAMDAKTLRDLDIKQMVKDYFAGQKFPLALVKHTVST